MRLLLAREIDATARRPRVRANFITAYHTNVGEPALIALVLPVLASAAIAWLPSLWGG